MEGSWYGSPQCGGYRHLCRVDSGMKLELQCPSRHCRDGWWNDMWGVVFFRIPLDVGTRWHGDMVNA